MLNGGGPFGLEILAFRGPFRVSCHLEQDPGILFGVSRIENRAAGDQ
jgi:hypothetical protein